MICAEGRGESPACALRVSMRDGPEKREASDRICMQIEEACILKLIILGTGGKRRCERQNRQKSQLLLPPSPPKKQSIV